MSQRAIEFIEFLEKGRPPMDNGYIYFEGCFFSCPFWYRFQDRTSEWEWTNDLLFWNSIHNKVDKELYYVSSDNIYIINYLRLKSKSKNITLMETNLTTLENKINDLYNSTTLVDKIDVSDELVSNESVQDYLNQLSFERNLYNNQLSQLSLLEIEYSRELSQIRTRNSMKSMKLNYNQRLSQMKLDILESRFKYNLLSNQLAKLLHELKSTKENEVDLLLNYKLEDEVAQAACFFNGSADTITNQDLANAFNNYQKRLLGLMSIYLYGSTIQNQMSIENAIVGYQSSLSQLSQSVKAKTDYIGELQKINNLLKSDNSSFKNDYVCLQKAFSELERISQKDKQQLDIFSKDLNQLKLETKKTLSRMNTLEGQVSDLENIRNSLIKENEQYIKTMEQLGDSNISLNSQNSDLKKEIEILENKNAYLLEKILEHCPDLVYNKHEQCIEKKEDTYDIIDLENE